MITKKTERTVTLNLTDTDRLDWSPENYPEHTFVVERVELVTRTDATQYVYLTGPWVVTPERLVGKDHLSVTGWDHLDVEREDDQRKLTALPDEVLIQLDGLKTELLPL